MKISCWNVRGANDPLKQSEIKKFIKRNKIDIMGLMEVKVRESKIERVAKNIFPRWKFCHSNGTVPRIWCGWNGRKVSGTVVKEMPQCLTLTLDVLRTKKKLLLSVVYGANKKEDRLALWQELKEIYETKQGIPWAVMGDFNTVLSSDERCGGRPVDQEAVQQFQNCLEETDLLDLPARGVPFTWSNRREGGDRILSKLDRILISESWKNEFPYIQLDFLSNLTSDHAPAVLYMAEKAGGPKPFRFTSCWMKHPEFKEILQKTWSERVEGNPLKSLHQKLKNLKKPLKKLNQEHFSYISMRVECARKELEKTQTELMQLPHNMELQKKERNELNIYADLLSAEETYYKEKARVKWLKDGDKNSKFFQRKVKSHQVKNCILRVQKDNGEWIEGDEEVKTEIVEFYKNLFAETGWAANSLGDIELSIITERQQEALAKEVTNEEIKRAVFDMKSDRAPGPDGYPVEFFKNNWEVVGQDVIKGVQWFFETYEMDPAVNATTIALIPKKADAARVRDFRPIAC